MKTALVAGASGLVGTELVNQLIEKKDYNIIHLLVRKPLKFRSEKVVEHLIDFNDIDKWETDDTIDHAFCALGTTIKKAKTREKFRTVDFDFVLSFAKKSKELKADKFLLISSLGANAQSIIFYNRVKGEIENALKTLIFPNLFIFRPSLLMGDRKEKRSGEKTAIMVYKVINPLFIGRLNKYKGIEARQVAKGMIITALKNEAPLEIIESDQIQKL